MDEQQGGHDVPEPGGWDRSHAVVRAGLSAIPVAGGAAVELFTALVQPPLQRRQHAWMVEVAESLRRLEADGRVTLEDLAENEGFFDTLVQASRAALATGDSEKRDYLRAAVVNSALPHPPESTLRHIYVDLIERLTAWHVRILALFADPPGWGRTHGVELPPQGVFGGLNLVLETGFPELVGRRDLYDHIWRDLYLSGLVNTEGLHASMTAHGLAASRATALGLGLLAFIQD